MKYDRDAIIRDLDDARSESDAERALAIAGGYLATPQGRGDDEVMASCEGAERVRLAWRDIALNGG